MANYTVAISFTAEEETAMRALATKAEKTVQQVLDEQVEERVMGQCQQWMSDEVKAELEKITPAKALTKLAK